MEFTRAYPCGCVCVRAGVKEHGERSTRLLSSWRPFLVAPLRKPSTAVALQQSQCQSVGQFCFRAHQQPSRCGGRAHMLWPHGVAPERASFGPASCNPLAVVLRMQVLCGTQRGPLWPRIFGVRVQAGRYALRGVVSYLRLHISRLCVLRTVLLGKAGPAGHCQGLGQCAGLLRICFHRPPCGPTN